MAPMKDWAIASSAQMALGWVTSRAWGYLGSGVSLGEFGVLLGELGLGPAGVVAAIPAIIYNVYDIMVKSDKWVNPLVRSRGININPDDKPDIKVGDMVMQVTGYETVAVNRESIGQAFAGGMWEAEDAPSEEWTDINHLKVPITEIGVCTEVSKNGHMRVQFIDDDRVIDGKGRRRMQAYDFIEGVEVLSANVHSMAKSLQDEFMKHPEFAAFVEVTVEATKYMKTQLTATEAKYLIHHPEGDDVYEAKSGQVYDRSNSRDSFTQNGNVFERGMLCDYHHTSYTWRLGLISHAMVERGYFIVWDLETGLLQNEVKVRPMTVSLVNTFDKNIKYKSWRQRCLSGKNNRYNPPGKFQPALFATWNSRSISALADPSPRMGERTVKMADGTTVTVPAGATVHGRRLVEGTVQEPVSVNDSAGSGNTAHDSQLVRSIETKRRADIVAQRELGDLPTRGGGERPESKPAAGSTLIMAGVAGLAFYFLFMR